MSPWRLFTKHQRTRDGKGKLGDETTSCSHQPATYTWKETPGLLRRLASSVCNIDVLIQYLHHHSE